MSIIRRGVRQIVEKAIAARKMMKAISIYKRYRTFTMIPPYEYESNLLLCELKAPATGCIVEAGVWRDGMSAGLADILPGRVHYLFDSFEGLPPAKEIDGEAALRWQQDTTAPDYYDNCSAERSFAESAMAMSGAGQVNIVPGWFNETVSKFQPPEPIAVLRLDGDWYESTMDCLTALYPHVMQGGLIILDDYFAWDGCALALHDYLSQHKLAERIEKFGGVCHIVKRLPQGALTKV